MAKPVDQTQPRTNGVKYFLKSHSLLEDKTPQDSTKVEIRQDEQKSFHILSHLQFFFFFLRLRYRSRALKSRGY